tara:strand:- start:135 stop:536 length:402 start_codon:yes stop_codon:yes gene_type:complete
MKTSNAELQARLLEWCGLLATCATLGTGSGPRLVAINAFVDTFAPGDVNEEDRGEFALSIHNDDEFLQSLIREINQCESGTNLESIGGDQNRKAIFTLKPLDGQLKDGGGSLDIVREVEFQLDSSDGKWRATG